MSDDVGAEVALTDAEESRMFFALFEPDDDCAHNVAPLYAEVERIIAVRVEAARAEALREAADEVRRIREDGLDSGMTGHPTSEHFERWLHDRAGHTVERVFSRGELWLECTCGKSITCSKGEEFGHSGHSHTDDCLATTCPGPRP